MNEWFVVIIGDFPISNFVHFALKADTLKSRKRTVRTFKKKTPKL